MLGQCLFPGRRLTPASAGTTDPPGQLRRPRTAHPRVGGDTPVRRPTRVRPPVHPRVGGDPLRQQGLDREVLRFTPASAGTTARSSPTTPWTAAHPRVGGDHTCCPCCQSNTYGSPPRWQGPPGAAPEGFRPRRLTPASAGSTTFPAEIPVVKGDHLASAGTTSNSPWRSATSGVHPRFGGDHRRRTTSTGTSTGSPPASAGTTLRP